MSLSKIKISKLNKRDQKMLLTLTEKDDLELEQQEQKKPLQTTERICGQQRKAIQNLSVLLLSVLPLSFEFWHHYTIILIEVLLLFQVNISRNTITRELNLVSAEDNFYYFFRRDLTLILTNTLLTRFPSRDGYGSWTLRVQN